MFHLLTIHVDGIAYPVLEATWSRKLNHIDTWTLRLPNSFKASSFKDIELKWGDDKVIPWTPLGYDMDACTISESPCILGYGVVTEFLQYWHKPAKQTTYYQLRDEGDKTSWRKYFREIFDESEDFLDIPHNDEFEEHFTSCFASPTLLIWRQGAARLDFFHETISLFRRAIPELQGWYVALDAKNNAKNNSQIHLARKTDEDLKWDDSWTLSAMTTGSLLDSIFCFEKDIDNDTLSNAISEIIGCDQEQSANIIPKPSVYELPVENAFDEKNAMGVFLEFELTFHSSSTKNARLRWKLQTPQYPQDFPPFTQTCMAKFVKWKQNLWEIELGGKPKSSLLVYPRLQFGGRGVYVPPRKGDELLVTLQHGGIPVADVITKIDKNKEIKKDDGSLKKNAEILLSAKLSEVDGNIKIEKDMEVVKNAKIKGNLNVGE